MLRPRSMDWRCAACHPRSCCSTSFGKWRGSVSGWATSLATTRMPSPALTGVAPSAVGCVTAPVASVGAAAAVSVVGARCLCWHLVSLLLKMDLNLVDHMCLGAITALGPKEQIPPHSSRGICARGPSISIQALSWRARRVNLDGCPLA